MKIKRKPLTVIRKIYPESIEIYDYDNITLLKFLDVLKERNIPLEHVEMHPDHPNYEGFNFTYNRRESDESYEKRLETYQERLKEYNEWYEENKKEIENDKERKKKKEIDKLVKKKDHLIRETKEINNKISRLK